MKNLLILIRIIVSIILFILSLLIIAPITKIIYMPELLFVVINIIVFAILTKSSKDLVNIFKFYLTGTSEINFDKSITLIKSYKFYSLTIGVIGSLMKYILSGVYVNFADVYVYSIYIKYIPLLYSLIISFIIFYPIEVYLRNKRNK